MRFLIYIAALAAMVIGDQALKAWTVTHLELGESTAFLPGFMQLTRVHNYGAAWSSFSGKQTMLQAVTAVLMLAIVYVLVRRIVKHPVGVAAALLILSGGLGNFIDRVRLGYVVDMFHFEFWPSYPVFNVADICVVCGAILGSVYYLWIYEKYDMKPKKGVNDGDSDAPTE